MTSQTYAKWCLDSSRVLKNHSGLGKRGVQGVADDPRTVRRLFEKKVRFLTRPTLADISPSPP
jgi:hypothetical protein